MSNGEVAPDIFCDRKKQSTILNMIEHDCTLLYDYYNRNKQQLKQVIEFYEEFITAEMNLLFEQSNSFVEIVLTHRAHFKEFIRRVDEVEMQTPNAHDKRTEDFYIIYITVQEWLLQGPKGQQFYSMVDIDAFKFYQRWDPGSNRAVAQMSDCGDNLTQVNGGVPLDKIARLIKYGEPAVTFLAFQNNQPTRCDAATANNIRQVQEYLKNKNMTTIECIPTKCSYMLLPKLFYGLFIYSKNNQAHISINNRKYNFFGDGMTAIKAKNHASQRALRKLCHLKTEARVIDHGFGEPIFADKIENLVTTFCNTMKCFAALKGNPRNVVAGIVQTSNYDLHGAKVIVLASGTKGIDGEYMHREGTVHDSHAEIVARRSLMVYFYNQLQMLCDPNNPDDASQSIFTRDTNEPNARYRLKDGIHFHLFTSRAPCGDATAIYCKNSLEIGKLRVKVEKKEGYLSVDEIKSDVQLAGAFHEGAELYTACCSDKIARWNVVGIQGALLSRIIEPIYLESITMSQYKHYKEGDCLRAFYGRIEDAMPALPPPYRHNKPKIAFASAEYKRNTHCDEASIHSYNWIIGNMEYEKILSKTGLVLKGTMECPSRISKMELMKRFVDVMQRLPQSTVPEAFDAGQPYDKMKAEAVDYNCAKEACIKAFQDKNLGNWNKVQKPAEIEKFTL